MRLEHLSPILVNKYWHEVLPVISRALEIDSIKNPSWMNRLLQDILVGHTQVMIGFEEPGPVILLVLLTQVLIDEITGQKGLYIYAMASTEDRNLSLADWNSGYMDLARIARAWDCQYITGQTENDRVLQIVRSLGGSTKKYIVQLEV